MDYTYWKYFDCEEMLDDMGSEAAATHAETCIDYLEAKARRVSDDIDALQALLANVRGEARAIREDFIPSPGRQSARASRRRIS